MADIQNYVFIDGNYLRRAYEDEMRKFFPSESVDAAALDLDHIKNTLGASKAFYYDAVDELLDASGQFPDRKTGRVTATERQHDLLDRISSLDGFHVRKGSITGSKRTQKQVDVQLAVDALVHAFNKNMWHVSLITGDLDFKPLVDALVNLGIHVHLYYDRASASRTLYQAADVAVPMTIRTYWSWSHRQFKRAHRIPEEMPCGTDNGHPPNVHTLDGRGRWHDREVRAYTMQDPKDYFLLFVGEHSGWGDPGFAWQHHSWSEMETFFGLVHGDAIEWAERPPY